MVACISYPLTCFTRETKRLNRKVLFLGANTAERGNIAPEVRHSPDYQILSGDMVSISDLVYNSMR